jgi:aminoglycoside phosphotransferase (APT) family kinase protein
VNGDSGRATARTDVDFDPAALRRYLAAALPEADGDVVLERIGGGQSNPTYFVTVGGTRLVLRKPPAGTLAPGAHDVGREYRILRALAGTAVPVPRPVRYEPDPAVLGTPFYLMARVDGRVFLDAELRAVPATERRFYYVELARVLAELHRVDWQATELAGLARPGSFLGRQVERWGRAWGPAGGAPAEVGRVVDWLRAHLPDQEDVAIVHGDYKFTNVIFDPERPEIAGVLDWELCAIGDPLLDLAHAWSFTWDTAPAEYGGVLGLDLPGLGIPAADEFFAAYYEASDSPRRLTAFHLALAAFRNAGIFRGIAQRAESGSANAADAAEVGRLDRVYLGRALAVITAHGG